MANKTIALSVVPLCSLFLAVIACSSSNEAPAPAIVSTSPTSGQTGVAAAATITATFSEAMDPATVDSTTFTVKDSGNNAVSGTVSCSGTTATFTASLTNLVTYTATVTTGAKSLAGKALAADHSWSFTVATTPTPLLARATLKAWVDLGLVNGTGSNRVVVLDTSSGTYAAGHIPGAQVMNLNDATTPLYQYRQEGPAVDMSMVPDGAHMDAVVQKYGIDGQTTVVFTGSGAGITSPTRAYWTFRYWGFSKDKLKLLDGLNNGYGTAYGLTADASPAITPSTYGVKSNGTLRSDLRASLSEMMSVARGDVANAVILDARTNEGAGSYAGVPGSTAGVFPPPPAGTDSVVFEGHMKGARALAYSALYDATTYEFKSPTALAALLNPLGIDATKTTYVHCRTGVIASVTFFALDAILDWPVQNYDASWSQWGQLSGDDTNGGRLAADSPWRTDTATYSDLVVYNHSNTVTNGNKPVELLALDGRTCTATLDAAPGTTITYSPASCTLTAPESTVASGNQVEEADAAYMTP